MITTSVALPVALRAITERLNFSFRGPITVGRFQSYEVDLSDWNLSLTDRNPCIWVKSDDLIELSPSELALNLKDVVREQGWQNSTVLVFIDGSSNSIHNHLPKALPTFLLVDRKQQNSVQQAHSPTATMLDILLSQMSRSQLAPYETSKPVIGSRFFGRGAEINKVLQHPEKNYLFVGIRRIGKTSLLKEIKRLMDHNDPSKEDQRRRLYVDCTVISSEEEFLRTLTLELSPNYLKFLMGRSVQSNRYKKMMFDYFASQHGGPITFLVDEIDRLLSQMNNHREFFPMHLLNVYVHRLHSLFAAI